MVQMKAVIRTKGYEALNSILANKCSQKNRRWHDCPISWTTFFYTTFIINKASLYSAQ